MGRMKTNELNDNQYKAVHMPLSPTMVIAGPGSGKTYVITERIHYMLQELKCRADQVLVITFTKAAAEEMKSRYIQKHGNTAVTFGTFHAIFYKILRMSDRERYDLEHLLSEDKKRKLIEQIYSKIDGESYEDFIETFLAELTLMKNQLIQPQYYNPNGISKEVFLQVYRQYDNYKERHTLFDFDDMLTDCYHLLINNPQMLTYCQNKYKHILIDEFQDINCVQFEIIKLLSSHNKDLFVVGDDDQSIYQFRGSKPEFLLSFEKYFEPVNRVILNINYRSTKRIISYSNALIKNNKIRHTKSMDTYNSEGDRPLIISCKDSKEQAQAIAKRITQIHQLGCTFSECAVVYRTNIQARPLIETLLAAHIPFALRDTLITLYDQWVTKDVLRYLHLVQDMQKRDAIMQIINRPSRYISKAALASANQQEGSLLQNLLKLDELSTWQKDHIQELIYHLQCLKNKSLEESIRYIRKIIGYDKYINEYASYRKIPASNLLDVLSEIEESARGYQTVGEWEESLQVMAMSIKQSSKSKKQDAVTLTTMHSAKGLEFENVFVIDIVDGVVPHNKSLGEQQIEEERRLFYVALTRAKKYLYLYVPKSRYEQKVGISPFIEEMLTHSVNLQEGDQIIHATYGRGKILALHDTKARIYFDNEVTRVIDYHYCIKNQLLTREEKENGEQT